MKHSALVPFVLWVALATVPAAAQDAPLKVFISVDMEGIGGIGTGAMTRSTGGKDYGLGRRLMTEEVNAVVAAVLDHGPADIVVNDSHGDMQNLLHTELDPRVRYIQGNIKPLGMVQGLDASFDGVIFLGYHARAGDLEGFLAHTGSGAVKGLWLNGTEVGEGGLNAAFAGSLGVPVLLAAGDEAFTREISDLIQTRTVATKVAVTPQVAELLHPERVREALARAAADAVSDPGAGAAWSVTGPVRVRVRFASTVRPDILEALPGMVRIDGYTIEFVADDMDRAYRMIRVMYKYISW